MSDKNRVHLESARLAAQEPHTSAEPSAALDPALRAQLALLVRTGASANSPAFLEDFGELSPVAMGRLRALGLVIRKSLVRYGGYERRRTAYWPTLGGRGALLRPADAERSEVTATGAEVSPGNTSTLLLKDPS